MGKGPVSKQTRGLPPLVRALAFGCILLALLLCTQEVLAPKGGCIDGFYAEPEDTIDVIFLGSSHANAAFAPAQMWREQGFTGYVLYSWSQPMWVSYHYAVEAFKRQTPRVVVLEGFGLCYGTTYMTPADVDGTSDDYSLRIPPSLNRAALAVAMSRCQQNSPPFYRYLPMLRYHTRWKSLTAEDFTWFFQDHATTGKGYGPLQTVEEFPVPILEGEPEETPIYPQAEEYLYKLIALCRKKDVPLVFVVTPYETSGAEYGVFRRAARICAENGVPVLDYNTPGGRDIGFDYATDLADHAHVNTAGAQKISTDLAAYLAEHYGMPDKRGDAAYAAWDEAARMSRSSCRTEGFSAPSEVPLADLLLLSEIGSDGGDFSAAGAKGAFFSAAGFSGWAFSFWVGFSISSSKSWSSTLFSGMACSGAAGSLPRCSRDFSISSLIEAVSTTVSLNFSTIRLALAASSWNTRMSMVSSSFRTGMGA